MSSPTAASSVTLAHFAIDVLIVAAPLAALYYLFSLGAV